MVSFIQHLKRGAKRRKLFRDDMPDLAQPNPAVSVGDDTPQANETMPGVLADLDEPLIIESSNVSHVLADLLHAHQDGILRHGRHLKCLPVFWPI